MTFLPIDQSAGQGRGQREGYAGIYVSDHMFFPRDRQSRYTYSKAPDGSPFWDPETDWPDPRCLISAMAAVTTNLTFTTGVYIAPARDLMTVAKQVGTAAVLSTPGPARGRGRVVRGGVRPPGRTSTPGASGSTT